MQIGLLAPDLSTDNGWATYSLNLIRQLRARCIATTIVCARNSPAVEFETHPLLPAVTPPEGRHTFIKIAASDPARKTPLARLRSGTLRELNPTQ